MIGLLIWHNKWFHLGFSKEHEANTHPLLFPLATLAYAREHLSFKKIKRIHHVSPFWLEKFLCSNFSWCCNEASKELPIKANVWCSFPHITDYSFAHIPAAVLLLEFLNIQAVILLRIPTLQNHFRKQ